jgi:putative ABC transport system permease protein
MKLLFILLNLALLSCKQALRNRTRSFLTLLGVATGMFLFTTVETMQDSLQSATVSNADDITLVVYRENRFCPATSRLPEHYKNEIAQVPGVKSVIPIQIVVNNCGTSLDVVVFRGVPPNTFKDKNSEIKLMKGSWEIWQKRDDGALIGKNLAKRRKLDVGDLFDAAGITVSVSGIVEAGDTSQNDNVAFVHLPFLQQSSKIGLGVVTQFNVKVNDSSLLKRVAGAIDQRFKSDTEPTSTQPEKAFFANTATELIELIRFSRWIGLACVCAVVGLIANSILLTVRGKISEHAVLKTLGYSKIMIGWMVLAEGIFLSGLGGFLGIFISFCFLHYQGVSIGSEGLILAFVPSGEVVFRGIFASLALGVIAGLYPAWQAGRLSINESLKIT